MFSFIIFRTLLRIFLFVLILVSKSWKIIDKHDFILVRVKYILFVAVVDCSVSSVKALLNARMKLNIDVQNYCDTTALNQACSEGMTEIAEILLYAGASLKHTEDYNLGPIFNAARHNHPECLKLCIKVAKERGLYCCILPSSTVVSSEPSIWTQIFTCQIICWCRFHLN